jgi:uncharacterized Rmd1/YagE family protein
MSDNKAIDLLNSRVSDVSNALQAHITECSAQSRKLFWAVVSLLGFLVIKSLPFIAKMFPG